MGTSESQKSRGSPRCNLYRRGLGVLGNAPRCGTVPFIGHPRDDKGGKVLTLAHSGEIWVEIDTDECSPTDRSNPQRSREYRQFPQPSWRAGGKPLGPSCDNRLLSLLLLADYD